LVDLDDAPDDATPYVPNSRLGKPELGLSTLRYPDSETSFPRTSRDKESPRCWLNSPCNSSTVLLNSSRTCNIPHHGVAPDRNQVTIVGMELPAFQLSMNVFFRFHRNAPGSLGLVWRDLLDWIAQSSLPARSLSVFLLQASGPKTHSCCEKWGPKIRNPASSA